MSDITTFPQAVSRPEDESVSGTPEASGQRSDSLREGDPITGVIDIANELAYMVPGI